MNAAMPITLTDPGKWHFGVPENGGQLLVKINDAA